MYVTVSTLTRENSVNEVGKSLFAKTSEWSTFVTSEAVAIFFHII